MKLQKEKQTDSMSFDRNTPPEENEKGSTIHHHGVGGEEMDIYQLDYILHEPEESHGWMYRAEIPDLQGCRAWGESPAETLEELREVARNMIQLRRENGEPLPPGIPVQSLHKGNLTVTA